jgi:hypothetical protein
VREGRAYGEGEYSESILYSCKKRAMKSVEIVLRQWGRGIKDKGRGGESN